MIKPPSRDYEFTSRMPYFVGRLEISFIRDIRAGVRIGRWHALPSSLSRKKKGAHVILKCNLPWRLVMAPYCALGTRGFVRYRIVRYAIATIATIAVIAVDSKLDMLSVCALLAPRYKNEMECDRYDPAYSFPTTMTTDNGEDEDDGNDDEDREDTMAEYDGVAWSAEQCTTTV